MASQAQNPDTKIQKPDKVPAACERCRKQKLKCDIQRPCIMCVRANADCRSLQTSRWVMETGTLKGVGRVARKQNGETEAQGRATKRRRHTELESVGMTVPKRCHVGGGDAASNRTDTVLSGQTPRGPAEWQSSSTIVLVEEAFRHHDSTTPQEEETSAFAASQWTNSVAATKNRTRRQANQNSLRKILSQHTRGKAKQAPTPRNLPTIVGGELQALLPKYESAALLVDNYFDRVHWFMLLFHQRNFRDRFKRLHAGSAENSPSASASQVGYIAVLLSVCAISLQYTTPFQKEALVRQQIDPGNLKEEILTALKLRLLDILSLGSLEAVQTCVLLGSYYLYQGQPELAWPLCGCGLRIAQALNLHRRVPSRDAVGPGDQDQGTVAARQRCWWAVYEIETFCCMLYGFPQSISDCDCDVEELDPHDDLSAAAASDQDPTQPNLLFFKCAMSKLSRVVKCAVTDLYGTHRDLDTQNRLILNSSSRLKSLVNKVADLHKRLSEWRDAIPARVRLVNVPDNGVVDEGKAKSFTEQLFQLQALALKLAYENARILVHRPLLSYKMVIHEDAQKSSDSRDDPFRRSIQCCRDAALEISRVGSTPVFRQAADTYAATFVALHLFTAGVTLCIMTSLDPLSHEAHESKLGIRRLLEMQNTLKPKSTAASQGLDILRRLLSLVMAKEIDTLFEVASPTGTEELAGANSSAKQTLETTSSLPLQPWSGEADQTGDGSELPCTLPASVYCGPDFGFCENSSMVEALLDLEQAISCPTSSMTGQEFSPTPSDNNCVVGQDQAWIWGWDWSLDAADFA